MKNFRGYWEAAKDAQYFKLDNLKELRRLRGEEETMFSDFKSPRWVVLTMLTFGVSLYILILEFEKLGEQKA